MIVQWCVKGVSLPDDESAREIIDSDRGLVCSWWRTVHRISPPGIRTKLTLGDLDRHVNHFTSTDPASGKPFCDMSPFISLSAGTIERDAAAQTNHVHRARRTALWFGTQFGALDTAYLFTCWILLAPRSAVGVEAVAEEVRDLNTYRRYSAFQTEGEVLAKIIVPANQIRDCQKWTWNRKARSLLRVWSYPNDRFTKPEILTNVRELI